MIRFWRLAFRNLGRNRKRNLATGSAIAFGFAGILLLAAYTHRATNYLRVYTIYVVHTGHLAVFAKDGFEKFNINPAKYSLSPAAQAAIEQALRSMPGVERFEKQIRGQGLVGNGCISFPFLAQGYEPEVDRSLREHPQVREWMPKFKYLLQGKSLWSYGEEAGAILLSRGLSAALGKTRTLDQIEPGAPMALPDCQAASAEKKAQAARDANVQLLSGAWAGNLSAVDGEVAGVFTTGVAESDNSGIVAGVPLLQKLFDTDRVTQYAVWLKDQDQLPLARAELEAKLAGVEGGTEVLSWDEERLSPYYVGTVDFLNTLILAGGLVLATIIALSVLNSATMTILERSQEIGMYRSMGFRRSHIRQLYVQESLLLSLLSLLAGTAIGLSSIHFVNSAEILYHPPGVAGGLLLVLILPWKHAVLSGSLILFLVALATWLAVSNRLRTRPADLLGGTLR